MPIDHPPAIHQQYIGAMISNETSCTLVRQDTGERIKIVFRCKGQRDIVAIDIDKSVYGTGDFIMMQFDPPKPAPQPVEK